VSELVEADEDVADYVRRLEEADEADDDDPADLDPEGGETLAAEVERFLREHGQN
jgi:hypothetical protein